MIILASTTAVLQLVTGGSEIIDVSVSWMDETGQGAGAVVTPGDLDTQISAPGTTAIVPSPAASYTRGIEFVSITNTDAVNPTVITVRVFDGSTTSVVQQTFSLLAGYTLFYEDSKGWYLSFQGVEVITGLGNWLAVSAGTGVVSSGTVAFGNANGVSFGLNGSTVTASIAMGATSLNFSAGTTSNNLSAVTFGNANGVSFGLNGSTITGSFGGATVSFVSQDADFVTHAPAGQAILSFQRLSLAANVRATQLAVLADFVGNAASSDGVTVSHGVYSFSGGTANLASSASRAMSWTTGGATTATSVYGGVSGTRYRSIGVSYALTPGDYLFAWAISTANGVTVRPFGRAGANIVGVFDGVETSAFLNGSSVASIMALPSSVAATNTNYARTGFYPLLQPGAILLGT
jgi:hypothetical protein